MSAEAFAEKMADWEKDAEEKRQQEENSRSTMASLHQNLEQKTGQKLNVASINYGQRIERSNGQAVHLEGGKETSAQGSDEMFQSLLENKSIAYEEYLAGSLIVSDMINERGERIVTYALVQFEKMSAGEKAPLMDDGYDCEDAIQPFVEIVPHESPEVATKMPKEKSWTLLDLFVAVADKQEQPPATVEQVAADKQENSFSLSLFEPPTQPLVKTTPLTTIEQYMVPNSLQREASAPLPSFENTQSVQQMPSENMPAQPQDNKTFTSEILAATPTIEKRAIQQSTALPEIFHPIAALEALPAFEIKPNEPPQPQSSPTPEKTFSPVTSEPMPSYEMPLVYKEAPLQNINEKPAYFSPAPTENAAVATEITNSAPEIYTLDEVAAENDIPPQPLSPTEPLPPISQAPEASSLPIESVEIPQPSEKIYTPSATSEIVREEYTEPFIPQQESTSLAVESQYITTNAETIITAVETHLQPVAAIRFEPVSQQEAETFLNLVESSLAQEITAAIEQVQTQVEPSKVVISPRPGELALDSALIVTGNNEKVTLELFAAEEANGPVAAKKIIEKESASQVIIKESPAASARVIEISVGALPENAAPEKIRDSGPLSRPVEKLKAQLPAEKVQPVMNKEQEPFMLAVRQAEKTASVIIEETPSTRSRVIEVTVPRRQADSLVISPHADEDKTDRRRKATPETVETAGRQSEPLPPSRRTQIPFTTLPSTNFGPRQQGAVAQRAAQAA